MSTLDEADEILDGSEDEIEVTAKDVYEKLLKVWLNEKLSAELLPHHDELVECMMGQIKEIESSLSSRDKNLKTSLQKIELERVKFVISSYLRERLKKIENNVVHILAEEASMEQPRMSPEEMQFAKAFSENLENHFEQLALQQMPANMQSLDKKKNIPKPNLESFVFIKVLENVEQVTLDPEEDPVDLDEGSQHIVRYKTIAPYIQTEQVVLI
eukprot:TCONS_00019127-protein